MVDGALVRDSFEHKVHSVGREATTTSPGPSQVLHASGSGFTPCSPWARTPDSPASSPLTPPPVCPGTPTPESSTWPGFPAHSHPRALPRATLPTGSHTQPPSSGCGGGALWVHTLARASLPGVFGAKALRLLHGAPPWLTGQVGQSL